MSDGLKIAIGGCVTALLAWGLHGPLGQGKAFIDRLQVQARTELALRGLGDIQVRFAESPYSRTALLSGTTDIVRQSEVRAALRMMDGAGALSWSEPAPGAAPVVAAAAEGMDLSSVAAAMEPATPVVALSPAALSARPETPPPDVVPALVPVASAGATPAPGPAAGGAPVPLAQCQSAVDGAIGGRTVSFRSGSAWLNPTSRAIVADVAAALRRCQGYALEVGGHTDGHGGEALNREMSRERADRVRDALVEQGIAASALSARGYGSSRPLRSGQPGDPANRRITFTVSGGGA